MKDSTFRFYQRFSVLLAAFLFLFSMNALAETEINPGEQGDNRTSQYQREIILDGTLAGQSSRLTVFTVFLKIMNSKMESTGYCTGFIYDIDMIVTSGHCLDGDDLIVDVHYGIGGKAGFKHVVRSKNYRSTFPARLSKTAETPLGPASDYLDFNEALRDRFEANIKARNRFVNFAGLNMLDPRKLADFAVIKVPRIPKGYVPLKLYDGEYEFGMKVTTLGFGYYSRQLSDYDPALRWSEAKVVGHYTRSGETTRGLQIFSPTRQNICNGDSGGPVLAQNKNGDYGLLAINAFVYNRCANESWVTFFEYFRNEIDEDIKILRSVRDI